MSFRQPVSLLVLMLLVSVPALAQVPQLLNYQGKLVSGGDPVNGDQSITFRIYDVDTGGSELWSETQTVPVADGVFSVILGAATPLGDVFGGAGSRYLGVQVQGESEMTPRLQFVSSSYALRTQRADDVADGAIAEAKIQDRAVTNSKIAPDAVGTGKIQDGAVGASKLAQMGAAAGQVLKWDGATWQPAADNTGAAGGGITEIIAGTGLTGGGTLSPVTVAIADGGVGGAQIANDAITRTKIGPQAVYNNNIRDGAISAEKIANGAVVASKLNAMGAATGQVLKWTGAIWEPSADNTGASGGGNTLDQAYDQGGQGAGRVIDADAGQVVITGEGLSTTALVASAIIGGSVELLQGGGEEGGQLTIWDGDGQGAWEIDNFGGTGNELLRVFRDKGFDDISGVLNLGTSGDVGIGTVSPGARLSVLGRGGVGLRVLGNPGTWEPSIGLDNGSQEWRMTAWSSDEFIITKVSGATFTPFRISPSSFSDALVIGASGVGVNVSNPSEMLQVGGVVQSTTGGFKFPDGSVQTTAATGGGGGLSPIAVAFIDHRNVASAPSVTASSGNVTVTWDGSRYLVTIAGESYFFSSYVTVVTPTTENTFAQVGSVGGRLTVELQTPAGGSTNGAFQFVTYKP